MKDTLFYEDYRDAIESPTCFYEKNNDNIPHFHNCIELMYILKGELNATVSGRQIVVSEGDLLVIPSLEIHMFKCPKSVEDIVLMIPINYIPELEKLFSSNTFTEFVLKGETAKEFYSLMISIDSNANGSDFLMIKGFTYLILANLKKHLEMVNKPPSDHSLIQDIIKYIEENYTSTVNLGEIAKKFSYTESRLSHLFNKTVGCSFPEYIGRMRSKKAAYLLIYDNYTIIDAAMSAGFDSLRSFYRIFKKNYGKTPFQYVKSFKKE